MVNELPAGLAPPLHLIEEEPSRLWLWLLLLLVGVAGLWWRQRRRQSDSGTEKVLATVPGPGPTALERAIDALRERVVIEGDFRRGCHELAALLRPRFRGALTRTARELRDFVEERSVVDLLARLETMQFQRRPPDRSLFESVCRRAKAVALLIEGREQ